MSSQEAAFATDHIPGQGVIKGAFANLIPVVHLGVLDVRDHPLVLGALPRYPIELGMASEIAADIYGLNVLARNIEDHGHNTTRFLVMSTKLNHERRADTMLTTFVFQVRNIPAALYKAMGGFATNGVNMTKLESYMVGGSFTATQFYADIEGHPDDPNVKLALEELAYFTDSIKILGVYPASPLRG